ncbi:unnamed protein product [Tilletia controversa]|uniref:Phosphatidylinositol-specific phospholipase C X domain-containing protein n=3 Tax=Tilletia TaxID=13289 RepID=A0A8X7MY06_9BASI|nr:hypothetical protein CF336_g686 [Tilletia laevis]KAE8253195.1 hypothetical protein A4X06_0g1628 [Tilletia controversa]KAE8265252.1 hypothetical protein A4X03_0g388 [Tilletia caries]KAE8208576.1 hypothetical protein CF335_g302 [Tilletia laevis]CAD6890100.1 unnamed protein product [Tilletia caries]
MKPASFCLAAVAPLLLATFTLVPAAEALPFPSWVSSLLNPRATVCNGFASNCDKKYSNFTVIGTHDSYAISASNLAANQDVSITAQLNAGIRMLQSQAHQSTNRTIKGASGIDLCHTSCSLYQGGSLESYLTEIKAWVDQNPTEVLTILIVNSDSLPASQFAKAYESTGLAAKSYRPSRTTGRIEKSDWPTLGTLIDAGTPVVNFLTSYADDSVGILINEFTSMWEPRYNQVTTPFNCSVDRIARGYDPTNLMYIANHFKDQSVFGSTTIVIPDKKNMPKTNSKAEVLADANNCASMHSSYPTFILVDFFNTPRRGGPLEAAAQMNGTPWSSNSTGVPAGSITASDATIPSSGNGTSTGTSGSGTGTGTGTGMKNSAESRLPAFEAHLSLLLMTSVIATLALLA